MSFPAWTDTLTTCSTVTQGSARRNSLCIPTNKLTNISRRQNFQDLWHEVKQHFSPLRPLELIHCTSSVCVNFLLGHCSFSCRRRGETDDGSGGGRGGGLAKNTDWMHMISHTASCRRTWDNEVSQNKNSALTSFFQKKPTWPTETFFPSSPASRRTRQIIYSKVLKPQRYNTPIVQKQAEFHCSACAEA